MYLMRYIEKMGTGTVDMIRRCAEAGLPEPEFEVGSGFVTRIWRAGRTTLERGDTAQETLDTTQGIRDTTQETIDSTPTLPKTTALRIGGLPKSAFSPFYATTPP